jgi:hypothetical protein
MNAVAFDLSRAPRNLRAERGFKVRNLPFRARGAKQEVLSLMKVGILSELSAVVLRGVSRTPSGSIIDCLSVEDLGILSRRMVTDAGVAFVAQAFTNTTEVETINFHDSGTGVGAEAVGNTTLGTPTGIARVSGTQSNPAGGQYRSIATITYNAGFAITEHGLFSASTSGTLLDRSVFAAINVVNTDAIQFTYTITFNSGG